MKLPSLRNLFSEAAASFLRFPFVLFSAAIATFAAIAMVETTGTRTPEWEFFARLAMSAVLGIPLFFSAEVFAERQNRSPLQRILLSLFILCILVAYFFSLDTEPDKHILRYILFIVGAHLLSAFAPYIGREGMNGFWHYNKTIFLRFLTATLYSGALMIGLSLAMAAVENLFDVRIWDKSYLKLFFVIAGLFNTWFFLAGIPQDFSALETRTDYPRGLKLFTQYVLLPLVTVYLAILYAYGLKILVTWRLPQGWIGILVLAFSVAGILSLLLVWPIRNSEENSWIRTYSKWFYIALFPLIVLLFIAIGRRVADYGITEERYFVMGLGVWLFAMALYFSVSKTKNIKILPVSLCLLAFGASFGPWGAFEVSKRSQFARLESILRENGKIKGDKISERDSVSNTAAYQVNSVIDYLADQHGLDETFEWLQGHADSAVGRRIANLMSDTGYTKESRKRQLLHIITGRGDLSGMGEMEYYSIEAEPEPGIQRAITVRDYGYAAEIRISKFEGDKTLRIAPHRGLISLEDEACELRVRFDGQDDITIPLDEFINRNMGRKFSSDDIDHGRNALYGRNTEYDLKVLVHTVSGRVRKSKPEIEFLGFTLLIRVKNVQPVPRP